MPARASIKDVAARAGVAISTVSKVMKDYPGVSSETKERVWAACRELNFVPNAIASALSSKSTKRIALIVNLNTETTAFDEVTMQYLAGATVKAREMGYELITIFMSMIAHMSSREITNYLQVRGVEGILICGLSKNDKELLRVVESNAFKIVLVDGFISNETTSSIGVNQKLAQKEVAKRTIVDNKCTKILYIAGNKNSFASEERQRGMEELAREMDLKLMVRYGDFSEKKARELTFQYAKNKDAVICSSDLMAIGAMRALMEMDIFRPVCGFDGIILMAYAGMQMNTIAQHFSDITKQAVEELDRLLTGHSGRLVVTDHELVRMKYTDVIR